MAFFHCVGGGQRLRDAMKIRPFHRSQKESSCLRVVTKHFHQPPGFLLPSLEEIEEIVEFVARQKDGTGVIVTGSRL